MWVKFKDWGDNMGLYENTRQGTYRTTIPNNMIIKDFLTGEENYILSSGYIKNFSKSMLDLPEKWRDIIENSSTCDDARQSINDGRVYYAPFYCEKFENGRAVISWQIQPDGRFYCDDDGYGGGNQNEIILKAEIDRKGQFITPFKIER